MQKYNQAEIVAHVFGQSDMATVLVVTYDLDQSGTSSAAEFREMVTQFPLLDIPGGRKMTFAEEFRFLTKVTVILDVPRSQEQQFIRAKLAESYGPLKDLVFEPHPSSFAFDREALPSGSD